MAFTSRSLRAVRRLGPESSRLLKDAEDLKDRGFTSAANQIALQAAQIKQSESPVDTPALRESREAAQRAIAMGQQIAVQGDFDPAEVVAPLKQKFLGSLSGLSSAQQSAMLNRFEPEFRKQRILHQAEQKSFLDLKEAQRRARLNQATDALKAPVAARVETLMGSALSNNEKQQELNRVIFQNPDVLRSPEMVAVFNNANNSLTKKLDAKLKEQNNTNTKKFSLTQQAIAAGKPSLIPALWAAKKEEDLIPISQQIAEQYGAKAEKQKADANRSAILKSITASDMSGSDKQLLLAALSQQDLDPAQALQGVALGEARVQSRQAMIQQIDSFIGLAASLAKDDTLMEDEKTQAIEDLVTQLEIVGIVEKGELDKVSPMTIQAILIGKKTELAKQDTQMGFASNFDSIN